MGAPWQRYRQQTKWCKLEDAVRGNAVALEGGETWDDVKKRVPSLDGILNEALNAKAVKIAVFTERYAATREQIKQMNMFFVSYHPLYGAYFMSLGPYVAPPKYWDTMKKYAIEKGHDRVSDQDVEEAITSRDPSLARAAAIVKADLKNQFSFFTRRFALGSQDEVIKSANLYIKNKIEEFSNIASLSGAKIDLTLSDLMLKAKSTKAEKEGGVYLKKLTRLFDNIDPKSPEGEKLYSEEPVLGSDSQIEINERGIAKIMLASAESGNWKGLFDQAIVATAESMGKDVETMKEKVFSDIGILTKVIEYATKVRQSLIDSGNPAAAGIGQIPDMTTFKYIMKSGTVGSQQPTAMRITDTMINLANLKANILGTIAELNTNDPKAIANAINSKRSKKSKASKAQGEITPEFIVEFLKRIKMERAIRDEKGHWTKQKKSFGQLFEEAKETYEFLVSSKGGKVEEGVGTMKQCVDLASMHFFSPGGKVEGEEGIEGDQKSPNVQDLAMSIDNVTKAKMDFLRMPPPNIFNWSGDENYTSAQLNKMRIEAERIGKDTQGGTDQMAKAKMGAVSPGALKHEIMTEEGEYVPQEVEEIEKEEIEAEPILPNDGGIIVEEPTLEEVAADEPQLEEEPTLEPEVFGQEGAEGTEGKTETPFGITDVTDVEETPEVQQEKGEAFPVEEIPADNKKKQDIVPSQKAKKTPKVSPAIVQPQAPSPFPPEMPEDVRNWWKNKGVRLTPDKKRKNSPRNVINPTEEINPVANSLGTLIKIARELDSNGKYAAAEEVHKVIRKYQERIK